VGWRGCSQHQKPREKKEGEICQLTKPVGTFPIIQIQTRLLEAIPVVQRRLLGAVLVPCSRNLLLSFDIAPNRKTERGVEESAPQDVNPGLRCVEFPGAVSPGPPVALLLDHSNKLGPGLVDADEEEEERVELDEKDSEGGSTHRSASV